MTDRLDLARELVDRILAAHAIGLDAEEIASLIARGMELTDEAAAEAVRVARERRTGAGR